eukprot:CAMPEP_0168479204 /NCGR_PEP_ID=MMETSP0228-20121227/63352_1 /TAXON_ID=133427 /ORGANISM="Protoceratium reticulatum, Strain CCCM 535 (=CCMP 1889)" /LENGTH=116 /DNA_ID=CAMNT_0008495487 /DNA_START=157 /DNA_END=505 /DNA_ORIENTATION=+
MPLRWSQGDSDARWSISARSEMRCPWRRLASARVMGGVLNGRAASGACWPDALSPSTSDEQQQLCSAACCELGLELHSTWAPVLAMLAWVLVTPCSPYCCWSHTPAVGEAGVELDV